MDSKRIATLLRSVLAGDFDFEAPSHRTSSGIALFLGGVGAGVLLGMLFAPVSGEQLRSEITDRTREGFEKAKTKTQDFAARQKGPSAESAASSKVEKNVS